MAGSLGKLSIELVASSATFESAMSKAEQVALKTGAQLATMFDRASASSKTYAATLTQVESSQRAFTSSVENQTRSMNVMGEAMRSTSEHARVLRDVFVGFAGLEGIRSVAREMVNLADEAANVKARLSIVEGGTALGAQRFDQMAAAAGRAHQPLEVMAQTYLRVATSTAQLGYSNEKALQITETVAKAIKVSGSSATEAAAALYEFGHALSSGNLEGRQFRALSMEAPILLQEIAKASGRTTAELRAMGQQGLLTGDFLVAALDKAKPEIDKLAQSIPNSIGNAFVDLHNKMLMFVTESGNIQAANTRIANSIKFVGDNIHGLATGAELVAVAFGSRMVVNMGRSFAEMSTKLAEARKATQAAAMEQEEIQRRSVLAQQNLMGGGYGSGTWAAGGKARQLAQLEAKAEADMLVEGVRLELAAAEKTREQALAQLAAATKARADAVAEGIRAQESMVHAAYGGAGSYDSSAKAAADARALAAKKQLEVATRELTAAEVALNQALISEGVSLSAVQVAETRAAAEANALAASTERVTLAQRAGAVASAGLGSVVNALGGPVGIAITAITILGSVIYDKFEDGKRKAQEFSDKIKDLQEQIKEIPNAADAGLSLRPTATKELEEAQKRLNMLLAERTEQQKGADAAAESGAAYLTSYDNAEITRQQQLVELLKKKTAAIDEATAAHAREEARAAAVQYLGTKTDDSKESQRLEGVKKIANEYATAMAQMTGRSAAFATAQDEFFKKLLASQAATINQSLAAQRSAEMTLYEGYIRTLNDMAKGLEGGAAVIGKTNEMLALNTKKTTEKSPGQSFLDELKQRATRVGENEIAMLRLEAAEKKVSAAAAPLIANLKAVNEAAGVDKISSSLDDIVAKYKLRADETNMTTLAVQKMNAANEIDKEVERQKADLIKKNGELSAATTRELQQHADAAKAATRAELELADAGKYKHQVEAGEAALSKEFAKQNEELADQYNKLTLSTELYRELKAYAQEQALAEAEINKIIKERNDPSFGQSAEANQMRDSARQQALKQAQQESTIANAKTDKDSGFKQALDSYTKEATDTSKQTTKLYGNMFSGIEGVIDDLATKGKTNFRSFATSIEDDIAKIIIKTQVLGPLMQGLQGMFGGGGADGGFFNTAQPGLSQAVGSQASSLVGNMFSSYFSTLAVGGAFTNGIKYFADGGAFTNTVASQPTIAPMAVFGEAGPEAIMPLRRGADGSLGIRAQGAGMSHQITQHISIDARGADSMVDAKIAKAMQENKADTIRAVNESMKRSPSHWGGT